MRGSDSRPRLERFRDADAYRARLAALQPSSACGVSIDDVAGWLDALADTSGRADEPV